MREGESMMRAMRRMAALMILGFSLLQMQDMPRAASVPEAGRTEGQVESQAERREHPEEAPREAGAEDGAYGPEGPVTDSANGFEAPDSGSVSEEIFLDPAWDYAGFSAIHTGAAVLTHAEISPRGITVCVNAGHGTEGGSLVKTLCHPDGSPKVTGGSTGEGAIEAAAVSTGTVLLSGVSEAEANLSVALVLKRKLLDAGFDVLMIREGGDVQLDNIARTVLANNCSDAHIALHYDSTQNNKGFFYISVPEVPSYRSMEPVASHYMEHERLGQALLAGAIGQGLPIFGDGTMALDLTQTSYSTVPSVDVEVGDQASDYGYLSQLAIAKAIVAGVCSFFSVSG
jgi:N-acetylmuramoyl-L-alanine amidase